VHRKRACRGLERKYGGRETKGIFMLRIIGVERTQAIQYFGSTFPICANGQPCPDNSIPLVAGKPTVVRVYFEGAALNVAVTGFGVKLLPSVDTQNRHLIDT